MSSKTNPLAAIAFPLVALLAPALPSAAAAAPERGAKSGAAASPAKAARADIQATLGFVPGFLLDVPDLALPGTWAEMKGLQLNPKTALSGETKELIGLAVAAQIPCKYCIMAHTEFAKLNGASKAEIGEAVTMAAITRHWSTFLNGAQTDDAKFRADIDRLVKNAQKAAGTPPKGSPIAVVDGPSALRDVTQTLGFVPDFLRRFPDAGRAGAWTTMKDVQMNPQSAVSPKNKELIGLAVAAQVPCKYCVVAHTEFAKLAGASQAEIDEAIAMAAFTRHMSTLLNGLQSDEGAFRRDLGRLVRGAQAAAKANSKKAASHTTTAPRP